jgi:uncharacterized membrane protein YedE/YeeE
MDQLSQAIGLMVCGIILIFAVGAMLHSIVADGIRDFFAMTKAVIARIFGASPQDE